MNTVEIVRAPVLMRDADDLVVDLLWAALPPPVTDDPKDKLCRDNAATR